MQYNAFKLKTALTASTSSYDRTVVLIDCDGNCEEGNSSQIINIIEKSNHKSIIQVHLKWEIEEWICVGEGIILSSEKPSKILAQKLKYEKKDLPRYADNLNIVNLKKSSNSFSDFIGALS